MLTAVSGLFGWYGVSLFFATSGYLMATLVRQQAPARFMLHRIVRIYPLFFLVVTLTMLAFYASHFGRLPRLMALSLMPWGIA